jgi:phage virion morphogenesis protein
MGKSGVSINWGGLDKCLDLALDKLKERRNLKYARIHQLGGKAGRGRKTRLPARPYLGISEEDKEEVAGIIGDYLKEAFTE